MASFNERQDSKALIHLHGDTIVVLVEGVTDVAFLERMFPGIKGDIRFEAVGGCTAVKERLAQERNRNPKVVGLLDRDSLLREKRWDTLLETDNDNFARSTCVDGLYVLSRWEIENYLFDLTAVFRLFDTWRNGTHQNHDMIIDMMIADAKGELHVTAGWCVAHDYGLPQDEEKINPCTNAEVLHEHVRRWISDFHEEAPEKYNTFLARINSFDPGESVDKIQRLNDLLRVVDGKRFLKRLINRWLNMRNENPSNQLADNVGLIQSRSDDLYQLVQTLRRSA